MPIHSAARLAAPLICVAAFLGVTAAWFYDVYVFSVALNHPSWEYLIVAGPYVAVGVLAAVIYLTRANLVFSLYGLAGALFITGCGLLLWYGNFFGSGNDLGFGLGLLFQLGFALAIAGTGGIAMLLHKVWRWWRPSAPASGVPVGPLAQ